MHYKLYSYIWHASTCSVSTCGGCFPRCQRHSIQQREIKLSQHENFMGSVSDELWVFFVFLHTCLYLLFMNYSADTILLLLCSYILPYWCQIYTATVAQKHSLLAGTEQPLLSCVKMSCVDCGVIQRRDLSHDQFVRPQWYDFSRPQWRVGLGSGLGVGISYS